MHAHTLVGIVGLSSSLVWGFTHHLVFPSSVRPSAVMVQIRQGQLELLPWRQGYTREWFNIRTCLTCALTDFALWGNEFFTWRFLQLSCQSMFWSARTSPELSITVYTLFSLYYPAFLPASPVILQKMSALPCNSFSRRRVETGDGLVLTPTPTKGLRWSGGLETLATTLVPGARWFFFGQKAL